MTFNALKFRLLYLSRSFLSHDLRISHLAVAASVFVGLLLNIFFAHGWTIWPAVLAFGILSYINEAVARNRQGLAPLQVYLFFSGAVAVWMLAILILASLNPLILILGIGAVLYRIVEALLRQRERNRL